MIALPKVANTITSLLPISGIHKVPAPFPASHRNFHLEAATDGLIICHCGQFLALGADVGGLLTLTCTHWTKTLTQSIQLRIQHLGVTVWVQLSSSISPPVFLPGVRLKQLSQVTHEKLSGNPVTWSSPVSGEEHKKGLVRVTF